MRLGRQALELLPDRIMRPRYDPAEQSVGIVHFVVGASHRANLAWYTDAAMNRGERDWAIAEVCLDSPETARKLNQQDGLFTLAERYNDKASLHLVASISSALFASEQQDAVIASIASPTTHIVALSLTEKSYCHNGQGGLDFNRAHSLSFYFFLTQALLRRQKAGLSGVTVLSCDGPVIDARRLHRLILQYLERHEPDLVTWFDENCSCVSSISDRFVATQTMDHRAMIAKGLGGYIDEACVMTEPFNCWLIEGGFAGPRPNWEVVGARIVKVPPPEEVLRLRTMKRARALLAYCGLESGYQYMHEASADCNLRNLVNILFLEEAAIQSDCTVHFDARVQARTQIQRFANRALELQLARIAEEEVQAIATEWFEPIAAGSRPSCQYTAAYVAMEAWLRYVNRTSALVRKASIDAVTLLLKTNSAGV
jgi:fructuronate reductase